MNDEVRSAITHLALEKVKGLNVIHTTENIIAAAIGASKGNIRIVSENDLSRKVFIYSDKKQTYLSFLWAGSYVHFVIIEKGNNLLDRDLVMEGLNSLLNKIPVKIPAKYLENYNMKPYLSKREGEIDKKIYISVPESARLRIGEEVLEYKLTYVPYDEFLIINGIGEILNFLYNNKPERHTV